MPSFQNDRSALMWGATAVPNAFFCEYMPAAPEGHVKVYLYLLMCASGGACADDTSTEDIARALMLDPADVERALRYWERLRLIERTRDNPPEYRVICVQKLFMSKGDTPTDEAYEAFANALHSIFDNRRKLHGGDTVLAYEWVEQMKLPPEVVLLLIRHMIDTRGVQFSFKEAQKVAAEMSEQHIVTLEAAEALFSRSEAAWRGARKVLARLGKRRSPSLDEIDLYLKWTGEWHFAPKAIEAACAETTKGDPSFGYLDGILRGLYERGDGKLRSASDVEKRLQNEREESDNTREVLAAFGAKSAIVDEGKRLIYRGMRELAEHEVIVLAAREVGKSRSEKHSVDNVQKLLESWVKKGIKTPNDVKAHLQAIGAQNSRLREIVEIAGKEDYTCSASDRDLLMKWRGDWQLSDALIDTAAQLSRNVDKPIPYMDKLLSGWRDEGALTPEAAREAHKRFKESKAAKADAKSERKPEQKQVSEQRYEQRVYDPAEFEGYTPEQLEEMKKL